jgi:hypothetical protein
MLICPSSWIKKRENGEECMEIMGISSSPPPWFEHWISPQFAQVNTASPACKAMCVFQSPDFTPWHLWKWVACIQQFLKLADPNKMRRRWRIKCTKSTICTSKTWKILLESKPGWPWHHCGSLSLQKHQTVFHQTNPKGREHWHCKVPEPKP